jgi:hypothetical protein
MMHCIHCGKPLTGLLVVLVAPALDDEVGYADLLPETGGDVLDLSDDDTLSPSG